LKIVLESEIAFLVEGCNKKMLKKIVATIKIVATALLELINIWASQKDKK
jgi:hypothetical protein